MHNSCTTDRVFVGFVATLISKLCNMVVKWLVLTIEEAWVVFSPIDMYAFSRLSGIVSGDLKKKKKTTSLTLLKAKLVNEKKKTPCTSPTLIDRFVKGIEGLLYSYLSDAPVLSIPTVQLLLSHFSIKPLLIHGFIQSPFWYSKEKPMEHARRGLGYRA